MASAPSTQRELAIRLLDERGVMRQSDFERAGVHGQTVARLMEEDMLFDA